MKQLPASCFSLCGLGSNKNSSTYFGNREDCTELIILVNALEFYLEHWAKVVACFGIDLIKVLFKDFLGKLVKSVWEPMIWRELVKDILLFSFPFLLLFLQAFRLLFPLNSNHKTHSLKNGCDASVRRGLSKRTAIVSLSTHSRKMNSRKGTLIALVEAMYTCRWVACELEGGKILVWSLTATDCYPKN